MPSNLYIDDSGVIIEDAHNDLFVLGEIKGKIHLAIMAAQDMQEKQALAKYKHVLEVAIDKLDDIIAQDINPIENKAEEGILYYESEHEV